MTDNDTFWGLKVVEWLTIAALVTGPVVAVLIARWMDDRRERTVRRMDIFKTLMRTRRAPVHSDHVSALNLIELEFADDRDVMKMWKDLFQHLNAAHQRRDNEQAKEGMPTGEIAERNNRFAARLYDERQRILAKLLHSMAKALRFKAEQLEIFEGGYFPSGWANLELEHQAIRNFALDLSFGRRVFPIAVVDYTRMTEGTSGADGNQSTSSEQKKTP